MDTQQLQAFVAIANTGSFSQAANQLHLTQPAISKRIALLEEQVKAPLFDRIGRQIALTQAGQILLPKAKLILAEVDAAAQAVADLQGTVSGKLSIATSHHIGLHYLPPYLQQFAQDFPLVKLDVHFLDSELAHQEVVQGRFDLALVTLALEPDIRIASHPLWMDELQFVAAPSHPLAHMQTLNLAQLSHYDAIMPDPNTYTTRLITTLFDAEHLPLNIAMVTNHLDAIKMLLGIGLGWGVLPKRLLDSSLSRLALSQAAIVRPLGAIHHRQRSLSNAANQFLNLLHQSDTGNKSGASSPDSNRKNG
ncbi:LysR family transcriptional regulator [Cellvibrio japonicus]|uniref:Transcriptional regulator, LysR family n=1 Tax=Cellvibrio japonicus (strain Ueda107) TaxID=498211 RepID=B3PFN1_CELJU|nr:LysR family transcriptional regulator [Cellvibrio japonicus]ACE85902.1 transcriptional regulator, LysR family [Cellvibrio japonicus Ueda107]QEI12257.1 LysR family transcriptional regulator [Cellvibrio japonicus]QEI15831.1 LysR family transcriptional regulator [Cellvibrio japonicus]QEI19409.1 LysR family transcriptional regulator [Cellvibrio japonicus]